jgi:acetyltransferase
MSPTTTKANLSSPDQTQEPEVVTLRDGTMVTIRPIYPDDAYRLQAFFARLSSESLFYRFLSLRKNLSYELVEHLATVDYRARMALVATCQKDGQELVIAEARYDTGWAGQPDLAEAAIVVEDLYQGQGLGTILAKRLVAYAYVQGIRAFIAIVNSGNAKMMRFIRRSGRSVECRLKWGVREVRIGLEPESDQC